MWGYRLCIKRKNTNGAHKGVTFLFDFDNMLLDNDLPADVTIDRIADLMKCDLGTGK